MGSTKKKHLIVLIIVGITVVFEIILRNFYSEELSLRADRPMVYKFDSIVNYTYIPDTIFRKGEKYFYINKQGFIGSDFGMSTPDSFRIAIVGSSGVAGSINLKSYHSFCLALQKKMNENGQKVKIMNCGVDGDRRSFDTFNMIRYKIMELKPDMILLEYDLPFCTNNTIRECYKGYFLEYPSYNKETFEDGKRMVDNLTRYKKGIDVLYYSYCIRAIVRIYKNYTSSQRKKYKVPKDLLTRYIELYEYKNCECIAKHLPTQYPLDKSTEMVNILRDNLRDKNITFFLFQYEKNNDVISIAKDNNIPLISLDTSFDIGDYFNKDAHLNDSGCQKIANNFYTILMKHKLIPENFIDK